MVVDGKRQRDKTVTVRLSKDEHEQLTSLSSRSGTWSAPQSNTFMTFRA